MMRWWAIWAAVVGMGTWGWAGTIPPPVPNGFPFRLGELFAPPVQTPHPAVVRVVVQERGGMSLGSGALVAVQGAYGLVLTNWHVVRDAAGPITVIFPNGFRSAATVLKVDSEWDLAALAIWRPQVEPIRLAADMPQVGEPLTIVGYGSGRYRAATGRCLQYLSPAPNEPPEMIELSVAARQGDSGGPILNSQGQLAGVLFGASWGRTAGSSCRRVQNFLSSLSAWFGPERPEEGLAAAPSPVGPLPGYGPNTGQISHWSYSHISSGPFPEAPRVALAEAPSSSGGFWSPIGSSGSTRNDFRSGSSPSPPWPLAEDRQPSVNSGRTEKPGLFCPPGQNCLPPASIPPPGVGTERAPQVWAGSVQTPPSATGNILPPYNSSQKPVAQWQGPWPETAPPASVPSPSTLASPLGSTSQNASRFETIKNFLAFVGAVALLLLAVRIVTGVSAE